MANKEGQVPLTDIKEGFKTIRRTEHLTPAFIQRATKEVGEVVETVHNPQTKTEQVEKDSTT